MTNDTMWTGVLVVLDWWTRISFHQVYDTVQCTICTYAQRDPILDKFRNVIGSNV